MKKIKYFSLIILLVIVFLLPTISLAFEINYPELPGGLKPTIGERDSLAVYVRYVFVFAFMVAGIIGVISIVIGGFQILLFAGSPQKIGDAKERVFNAVLGIVILMSAVILLRTINPQLVTPTTISLPANPTIFLIRGGGGQGANINTPENFSLTSIFGEVAYAQSENQTYDLFISSESDDNTQPEKEEGWTHFWYYCPEGGKDILLYLYQETDYGVGDGTSSNTAWIECGSTDPADAIDISAWDSYFWDYKNDGVYYFMDENCGDFGPGVIGGLASYFGEGSPGQRTSGAIPWYEDPSKNPFLNQAIEAFYIDDIPAEANLGEEYGFNIGVVLTQDVDGDAPAGECSEPVFNDDEDGLCVRIGNPAYPQLFTLDGDAFNPYGAHIFLQDKKPDENLHNRGITFWSNNKEYSLAQTGNENPDQNIELLWKYDRFSNPDFTDIPELDDEGSPTGSFLQNDGNIDNALRLLGRQANNNFEPTPADECRAFRPENPGAKDSTFRDPIKTSSNSLDDGRGYLSCLNKVTGAGDYNIILYTHNEQIGERSCQIFTPPILLYDRSVEPPFINILDIFSQFQISYKTVIVPFFDSSRLQE